MPKLKVLGGKEVVKILSLFGFEIASQKGKQCKIEKGFIGWLKQTLTIPLHKELD
ncbi:MAG: hypothetical protein QW279_07520 [Candidatus Jordarchaeaceae archaeon]